MNNSRKFWRTLFFFLLLAALCGSFAFPVARISVYAAPQMQATSCLGTTIAQWTFENVTTPVIGTGTFSSGSGLPAPSYAGGNPGQAVTFNSWTNTITLDVNDYLEFAVPTTGRNTISFNFDYRASATGPQSLEVHYSVDGGASFVAPASPTPITRDALFHTLSFDFTSIPALDDNAGAIFRIYAYAATGGNGGTFRFDNLILSGDCLFPGPTNTPTSTSTPTNTSTPTVTRTPTATIPSPTSPPPRTVLINEVAWSGTVASSTDEWFELRNTTGAAINLVGWRLTADDGNPDIALSGTIPGAGYFVIARYTAVFNDLTPDLTYSSGSLDNNGEILYLLDAGGRQIDTANLDGGPWNAGLGSPTYASMERIGNSVDGPAAWATYGGTVPVAHDRNGNAIKGTPGQGNWIATVTATPSRTPTPTRTPSRTRTPTPFRTPTRTRTPTRAPTIAPAQLVAINEFVPRPGHDWNNDGVVNVQDEYIEILNHGTVNVNLSGYSLDDEANVGSDPFRLPPVTLKPGERVVFYGSETGLLLGDGGDGVRLLKPNGQLMDAYNYSVVRYPDQSYCRLPDNGGLDDWNQYCYPTPGLRNSLSGDFVQPVNGAANVPSCPISDTLPDDFVFAECDPYGDNIWRRQFWDATGWYDEKLLPDIQGRWDVFAD